MPWCERLKGTARGQVLLTLFVLPLLSAILLALSYPKFDQGWLAWLAFAPFAAAVWRSSSAREAALSGLSAGFFFYAAILYWIYPTMRAGGVNAPVSVFGLFALSLLMSVEFAAAALSGFFLKRSGPAAWPYLFSLGWALLEYGKTLLSMKAVWFPWFMLGYTQWHYPRLIQIVSLTGVYGLSAAVCFTGSLAGCLILSGKKITKIALGLLPALAVVALLWVYGSRELRASSSVTPSGYLDVALLQPCIPEYEKWDPAKAGRIRAELEAMLGGLRSPDLILWPENALPGWIDDPFYAAWLKRVSSLNRSWNVVGSVSRGDGRHVSAFLLDPSGEIKASYDKRRLVPFGEYVPGREFLGRFIKPIATLGEFTEGARDQALIEVKGHRLGGAICYESIFTGLFAGDAAKGAEAFFNITNDGWYLDTAAPYQHFLANVFRAVETRRPVMRAANNGISGVIDPWGRILAKEDLDRTGVLEVRVPLYDSAPSFYSSRTGRNCLAAAALAAALFLAFALFKKPCPSR